MKAKPAVIKGYLYMAVPPQGTGKVKWDKAAWTQYLANYKHVKIEKVDADEGEDYLISARGVKDKQWGQRNLIAEAYKLHPTK